MGGAFRKAGGLSCVRGGRELTKRRLPSLKHAEKAVAAQLSSVETPLETVGGVKYGQADVPAKGRPIPAS